MLLFQELQYQDGIMQVNLCGNRYQNLIGNWEDVYSHVIAAFNELGYKVNVSQYLKFDNKPKCVNEGIIDSDDAIYVYNHTYLDDLRKHKYFIGKKALFIKPTGPGPNYFTIDTEGYAATSEITYKEPDYKSFDSQFFFDMVVPELIKNREHKWSDREDLQFNRRPAYTPKDHILVIGQMPGDETVTKISFGNHWAKLCDLVKYLKKEDHPLVIKLHPTLKTESEKDGGWTYYKDQITQWYSEGIQVLHGFESLYDILPNTKVAIVENSTAGIDCLIHQVPVISYGYPEYHWVTKDLRHLNKLNEYIEDLSWWDKEIANKWVSWYCMEYQCYDYSSTLKRLTQILA